MKNKTNVDFQSSEQLMERREQVGDLSDAIREKWKRKNNTLMLQLLTGT